MFAVQSTIAYNDNRIVRTLWHGPKRSAMWSIGGDEYVAHFATAAEALQAWREHGGGDVVETVKV